jgi:hypothetical protein
MRFGGRRIFIVATRVFACGAQQNESEKQECGKSVKRKWLREFSHGSGRTGNYTQAGPESQ